MIDVKNPTDERCRYIGVRSCSVKPDQDLYFGSSRSFNKWQKENGTDGLVKTILGWWPSREQAVKHEILLHDIFDVGRNKEYWNRAKQTATGFDRAGTFISEEHKEKVRIAHTGAKRSKEVCEKISLAKTGKPRSEETKKKLREANIGKNRGPMSDEQKKLRSDMLKGRKWYNNGFDVKLCHEGTQPDGWVAGDPIRKKDFATGKRWYTNGVQEILALPENSPFGWFLGRLNKKGIKNGI